MSLAMRLLGLVLSALLLLTSPAALAGLYDMVEMTVASAPGIGTITLGSPIPPYQSITATPAITGETVDYQIRDGNNWENGRGVLNFGATVTLTRGVVTSSNANAVITAGTGAVVWITLLAEDMVTTRYGSQVLAPISAPTCALINAATIAVNLAGCVSNPSSGVDLGAITLTQSSIFAFPTGLPTGGNLKFGFRINPGTFTATFTAPPSGYRFPVAQLTNGQPTLTASADNYVWCISQEGSPPTLVDCSDSMLGMTAVTNKLWVQGGPGVYQNTSSTTTPWVGTQAISTAQTVLCVALVGGASDPTGVNDGGGNTLTKLQSATLFSGIAASLWYKTGTAANASSTPTFTATHIATSSHQMACDVYSGITSLDPGASNVAAQTSPGTGANALTVTIATTLDGDLIYGISVNSSTVSSTAGSGFAIRTSDAQVTSYHPSSEDQIQTIHTNSTPVTFTNGVGTNGFVTFAVGLH